MLLIDNDVAFSVLASDDDEVVMVAATALTLLAAAASVATTTTEQIQPSNTFIMIKQCPSVICNIIKMNSCAVLWRPFYEDFISSSYLACNSFTGAKGYLHT